MYRPALTTSDLRWSLRIVNSFRCMEQASAFVADEGIAKRVRMVVLNLGHINGVTEA